MKDEEILFNNDGSVTISESTYKSLCLQLSENSPTYFYLLKQKERNIAYATKYLEKNRIREKAIIDVDVLEGLLNEVE